MPRKIFGGFKIFAKTKSIRWEPRVTLRMLCRRHLRARMPPLDSSPFLYAYFVQVFQFILGNRFACQNW